MNKEESNNDKPTLLKAVELLIADPLTIKNESLSLQKEFTEKFSNEKSNDEINELVVNKIISNYSYFAGFAGGATALTGVIPGLGTIIATSGGAVADMALSMKYQIEMTMAIGTIYNHDIESEEGKRICLLVAGLGTINEAVKNTSKKVTSEAFTKMLKIYLKGSTLTVVKEIFKKVGVTFTRKAVEKAIPFGVGVIIGFSANKGLTYYVGSKAKDFFIAYKDFK